MRKPSLPKTEFRTQPALLPDPAQVDYHVQVARQLRSQAMLSAPRVVAAALVRSVARLGALFGRTRPAGSEVDEAVATLKSYSDIELADLDVTRGEIEHIVRHGRAGYEEDRPLKAA